MGVNCNERLHNRGREVDEDGEESRMNANERERKKEERVQWGWKLETKEAVNYNEIPTVIYYSRSISIKGMKTKKKKKEQSLIKKN